MDKNYTNSPMKQLIGSRKINLKIGPGLSFADSIDAKSKKNYLEISTSVMKAIEKL